MKDHDYDATMTRTTWHPQSVVKEKRMNLLVEHILVSSVCVCAELGCFLWWRACFGGRMTAANNQSNDLRAVWHCTPNYEPHVAYPAYMLIRLP